MAADPFSDETRTARAPSLISRLRSNFLAGLIIIAPIGLTLWLIYTVVGWIDGWVWPFVPQAYQPEELINRFFNPDGDRPISVNVRGIGVVIFLIFTVIVGWIGKGLIGRSLLRLAERLVDRMPVVRSIYNGVKQIAETVFSQRDTSLLRFNIAPGVGFPRFFLVTFDWR